MAQLGDTIVTGDLRVTGNVYGKIAVVHALEVVETTKTVNCIEDTRFIINAANVDLTLGNNSESGVLAEVFALSNSNVIYSSTTLTMTAGTRANFLFYNGTWYYTGVYGAIWN